MIKCISPISRIFVYMPLTQLKDHYKVLGISPEASEPEIKKAFRKLAVMYHPDKNHGRHAEAYFIQVQQAYKVLSDPHAKKKYDNERWLTGMNARAKAHNGATAEWLLKEAIQLNRHMSTVDSWRMSHKNLYDYIAQLLSEENMQVLEQSNSDALRESVAQQVLQATSILNYQYMEPLVPKLQSLAKGNDDLQIDVYMAMKKHRRQAQWQNMVPYIAVIITTLLVVSMFFWGK